MRIYRRLAGAAIAIAIGSLAGCAQYAPGFRVGDVRADPRAPAAAASDVPVLVQPIGWELINQLQARTTRPAQPPAAAPAPYVIGPGDTLRITVWGDPELSGATGNQAVSGAGRVVSEDGTLFLPFAGVVRAAGLTPLALRDRLSAALARVLKDPQVEVQVVLP